MHGFKIKLFSFLLLLISLTELYGSDIWQNLNGKEWVLEEYFSVIRSHDRDTLIAKLPLIETNYYWIDEHAEDLIEYYWRDLYYIDFEIKFFEDKIYENYQEIKRSRCIHIGDLAEGFFTIQNLKSYDNIILLDVICDDIDDINRFIIKLPKIEKNKDYIFMLKFDGDYLDFYIDDVFIHTFCKINEATLKEYENLIKNNTCDLSKVTWPRHADGTSDYDDKVIMPEPLIPIGNTYIDKATAGKDKVQANIGESEKIKKVQVKSKNQIMAVKIPAVLRADPSIEKGTPMLKAATGSRVQIIKVGKKQIIDNIESNWVKVKFLDGAKKVTGKDISPDTVGWLFGGYLE